MKFPPKVTITPAIKKLLYDLDVLKASFELHPVSADFAIHLRRVSLLKSSLFSARIEGNPLELADVGALDSADGDIHKMEVANLLKAYEQLPQFISGEVSIEFLKVFHGVVLKDIRRDAGFLRTEESAIFNQAGVAVYVAPAPQEIRALLADLCAYVNGNSHPAPVVAGVTHIWFEKIHPFLDGNGRVGRLLSAFILNKGGYDFSGLVPFEEYLDTYRDAYYDALGRDRQDVTEFAEFYLGALLTQARISLKLAYEPVKPDPYAGLLPRRAEIMRIVEDHKVVTFDFLARRFRAVPSATLHYDVAQLVKAGLLRKKGTTRGAMYTLAEKP